MAKVNNKTNSANNRKRVTMVRRWAVKLFVVIATLMAIACGLVAHFVLVGGQITWTQVRFAHYYDQIDKAECERRYQQDLAIQYAGTDYGRACQKSADAADERVRYYQDKRADLQHSDNKVVAWAGKNQFDFGKLLLGILVMGIDVLVGYLAIRFFWNLAALISRAWDNIFYLISSLFYLITFHLSRFFWREKHYYGKVRNSYYDSNEPDDPQASSNSPHRCIPFKRPKSHRRGGRRRIG